MFNFNKRTTFSINNSEPNYFYCNDVIIFNELTNNFYYRLSSPWDGSNFIGKNSPSSKYINSSKSFGFSCFGYNKKQIQFPTTVVDLGPRDSFINEICCGE
jgi:hypothetical protein